MITILQTIILASFFGGGHLPIHLLISGIDNSQLPLNLTITVTPSMLNPTVFNATITKDNLTQVQGVWVYNKTINVPLNLAPGKYPTSIYVQVGNTVKELRTTVTSTIFDKVSVNSFQYGNTKTFQIQFHYPFNETTNITVGLCIRDIAGNKVAHLSKNLTLYGTGQYSLSFHLDTSKLAPGEYTSTLYVATANGSYQLNNWTFTVNHGVTATHTQKSNNKVILFVIIVLLIIAFVAFF